MKILFADLDDTLIKTRSGNTFAKGPWDWVLMPGICEAIDSYNPDYIHIISNQSGMSRGLVRENEWLSKVGRIIEKLNDNLTCHPRITYDYSKAINKDDPKRKPNPGMILEFLEQFTEEELEGAKTLMIGDASNKLLNFSDSDYQCAHNAGIDYLDIKFFLNIYK